MQWHTVVLTIMNCIKLQYTYISYIYSLWWAFQFHIGGKPNHLTKISTQQQMFSEKLAVRPEKMEQKLLQMAKRVPLLEPHHTTI